MSENKGFKDGQNCSQSVITYFTDKLGLDEDLIKKLSIGLGGGMGTLQRTCGAVTGGIMAIGLLNSDESNSDNKSEIYNKVKAFVHDFESDWGASDCLGILEGNDMNTPEGKKAIAEGDMRNNICAKCIETAIELIEKKYSK